MTVHNHLDQYALRQWGQDHSLMCHPHSLPPPAGGPHCLRRSPKLCCKAGNGSTSNRNNHQAEDQHVTYSQSQADQPTASVQLPSIADGINWYCNSCLGLLCLTDLTPVGQWLLSSASSTPAAFPLRLAALQWAVFVLPTLVWIKRSGWDLRTALKLKHSSWRHYVVGLCAGPVLWLGINGAVALRTGNVQQFAATLTGGLPVADGVAAGPGMLLLAVNDGSGASLQQVLLLLACAAVSPAVAEELLFRGLLLTAVQQRLGNIDAVAVVAALFALIHLDLQQFFLYCVLGGACGLLAVRSGSVGPAVALHAAFNATAVAAGLLVHR